MKTEAPTKRKFVVSGGTLIRIRPCLVEGHTVKDFREHTIVIEALDDYWASAIFRERTGFAPQMIGTREVSGHCEHCGAPIYTDESGAWWDSEGVMLCPKHAPEGSR